MRRHIEDRSIITNKMPPDGCEHKYPIMCYVPSRNQNENQRYISAMHYGKNNTELCFEGSEVWEKKQQRHSIKHYLNTDFLSDLKTRHIHRIEHLNSFRKKSDIINQYRDFIKRKFKTNYDKKSFS